MKKAARLRRLQLQKRKQRDEAFARLTKDRFASEMSVEQMMRLLDGEMLTKAAEKQAKRDVSSTRFIVHLTHSLHCKSFA